MRRRLSVLLFFVAAACQKEGAPVPLHEPTPPAVIRTASEVSAHVGEVITLEGVVEPSKQPTLLGVDVNEVDAEGHDARGKRCRATGRLEKRELVVEDGPISAHRSPGTYLALARTDGEGLAVPVPLGP